MAECTTHHNACACRERLTSEAIDQLHDDLDELSRKLRNRWVAVFHNHRHPIADVRVSGPFPTPGDAAEAKAPSTLTSGGGDWIRRVVEIEGDSNGE